MTDQTTIGDTVDSKAIRALWGSTIGYAMDGFDLLILGFVLGGFGFGMLAVLYVIDILAMWLLIPERRGAILS